MEKKVFVIIILILLCELPALSQVKPLQKLRVKKGLLVILQDTTFVTKRDTVLRLTSDEIKKVRFRPNPYLKSSRFYDSLAKKAGAHSLTKDILDLVVKTKKRKQKLVSAIVKSELVFKPYEGFTIGSIVFKHVDLIEGSVIDTLQKASSRFGKFVNKVHIDTRAKIIEQNLLFTVGDLVDPYTMADNERILRQLKVLRDVRIYVSENEKHPKVADITVVTQDVGSVGISGSYSSLKKYRLDVYDVNILGYAKQFQVSYFRSANEDKKNGYALALQEPNLLGTFIQGEVEYMNNYQRERTSLSINRDFFTPEIKYAGGLTVYRTYETYFFEADDTLEVQYKEKNLDLWVGRSLQFRKRVNLIFAARINPRDFTSNSPADSSSFLYDRTLLLGGITLTKRNFIKSLRIRGFGRTEDIPVGQSVGIVFGKEMNEFANRPYVELNGTFASYFQKIGYINISLALGSYYRQSSPEDGLIVVTSTYFSDLIEVRKLQLRQFIYFSYIKGLNRNLDKTIGLASKWETAEELKPLGVERTTLGLETVYFMPWYTYGFQFALFHRIDLNFLSTANTLLSKRLLFPSLRVGARMLNENLVFPAFSLETAYYGKNGNFNQAWEFKFSVTIPDLFGSSQTFKPRVHAFE